MSIQMRENDGNSYYIWEAISCKEILMEVLEFSEEERVKYGIYFNLVLTKL